MPEGQNGSTCDSKDAAFGCGCLSVFLVFVLVLVVIGLGCNESTKGSLPAVLRDAAGAAAATSARIMGGMGEAIASVLWPIGLVAAPLLAMFVIGVWLPFGLIAWPTIAVCVFLYELGGWYPFVALLIFLVIASKYAERKPRAR